MYMSIVLALVVIFLCWLLHTRDERFNRLYLQYATFRVSAFSSLDMQKAAIDQSQKVIQLFEYQVAAKERYIAELENQIINLKETVENLSDLTENGIEVDLEEEGELVYATANYSDSIHDQRIVRNNAIITLHEASVTLEKEKLNIPAATYENLAKHFRLDS